MRVRIVLIGGADDGHEMVLDSRSLHDVLETVPRPTHSVTVEQAGTAMPPEPLPKIQWRWDGGKKDSYDRYRFVRAD